MDKKYLDCAIVVLDWRPSSCWDCISSYGGFCSVIPVAPNVETLESEREQGLNCPVQFVSELMEDIEDDDWDSEEFKRGYIDCLEDILSDRHVKPR